MPARTAVRQSLFPARWSRFGGRSGKNGISRHTVTQRSRMNRGEGCDGVDDREAMPRIVQMERLHHFSKRQVLMLQRLADGAFDAPKQRFQRSLAAYRCLDHQDVCGGVSPWSALYEGMPTSTWSRPVYLNSRLLTPAKTIMYKAKSEPLARPTIFSESSLGRVR